MDIYTTTVLAETMDITKLSSRSVTSCNYYYYSPGQAFYVLYIHAHYCFSFTDAKLTASHSTLPYPTPFFLQAQITTVCSCSMHTTYLGQDPHLHVKITTGKETDRLKLSHKFKIQYWDFSPERNGNREHSFLRDVSSAGGTALLAFTLLTVIPK